MCLAQPLFLAINRLIKINPSMPPDKPSSPPDPTPIVGAATDISPLTHSGPKPAHERTAAEEAGAVDWQAIAASARFKELLRAKRRFIIPAMVVFIVYYFALPALVGYARPLMEKRVLGPVNLAYLFALSQFFMAWIIAALYVRAANRFDRQAREIIAKENSAP
jgi:uncharacterized membrane protein (DUF485 family)